MLLLGVGEERGWLMATFNLTYGMSKIINLHFWTFLII
ncbi:MAG: hypothetical protein BWX91_00292 [Spirochaetes bacterium ADurb.Bin133]|jgi:hypothetical protein|nr:MAG: hypothetical protein BWX91_00292 [Spirochaetes bacterium ADurb.Bin133]